jgi:hypothetical protein
MLTGSAPLLSGRGIMTVTLSNAAVAVNSIWLRTVVRIALIGDIIDRRACSSDRAIHDGATGTNSAGNAR